MGIAREGAAVEGAMPVTWGPDQLGRWWVQDVTGAMERAPSSEGAWLRAVHLAAPRGERVARASFSLPEEAQAAPPAPFVAAPAPVVPADQAVLPTGPEAQAAFLDRPAREVAADVRGAARSPVLAAELAAIETASANRKTVLAALATHAE